MNNAVTFTCYNSTPEQLELSKEALESIFAQDIPVSVYATDNGSIDEGKTWAWMEEVEARTNNFFPFRHLTNKSPVGLANFWGEELFGPLNHKHVLGVPNDVILPSNFYRQTLKWPRGVVTGSMTPERNFTRFEESHAVNTCTPMAVVMIRKWVWEALIAKDGFFFDPQYTHYASDCDFALRLAACGITGIQLDLQYFHLGSGSWRMAPHDIAEKITSEADMDRFKFEQKWGFSVSDARYGASAADINFRG